MNAYTSMTKMPPQKPMPDVLPTYDAKELTQNGVQAQITLDNQAYFLRITRSGKLILTK